MQISNNFSVSAAGLPTANARTAPSKDAAMGESLSGLNPVDQLDFSPEATAILSSENSSSDIRADKVASIRQQIAEGTYDTDEKLSAAIDKLVESWG